MKQKFVINSLASFKDINSSSLNKSSTKQTFSFSKTSRFQNSKPLCKQITYGGDFILHKPPATGIGYGKRSDFTSCQTVSPASSKYNFNSEFQLNKKRKKGNSVGLSRDAVVFNQYIPQENLKVPPSTLYQNRTISKQRAPSFSIRSKTKMLDRSMTLDPEVKNPGPGAYSEKKSDAFKFSHISYGLSRSKRFSSANNGVPGAGNYQNMENIAKNGKYNNSKHFGGTQAIFSRTPRISFFERKNKQALGPGSYKQPSQFGQYDGDVYGQSALVQFRNKK